MAERICSQPDCSKPAHALGYCKPHHAQANYAANADARRAQQAEYRARHRAEARERAARWRAANPDRVQANNRRSYAENVEHHLAYRRDYRAKNLDKVLADNRRRRAVEKGAQVRDLTAEQWLAIKELFGNCCAYCGRQMQRLTQDHVIPLTKGGNHTATNVVPACQSCNSRKGNRPAPPFHAKFRHLE
jgi:5-methylcytosine-specific restriction endonuclease McrA